MVTSNTVQPQDRKIYRNHKRFLTILSDLVHMKQRYDIRKVESFSTKKQISLLN